MKDYILIPCYSLKPGQLTVFPKIEGNRFSEKQKQNMQNLENNDVRYGELSTKAKKRLRSEIDFMMFLAHPKIVQGKEFVKKENINFQVYCERKDFYNTPVSYKLTFITLTLSAKQKHTDSHMNEFALKPFLRRLRETYKVELYIWKAEKQENGNIHYHILCDRFIQWQEIRQIWNKIQNSESLKDEKGQTYIERYQSAQKDFFKDGFRMSGNPKDKRSEADQRTAYENSKAEDWTNPNSTDIHALHKKKNVSAYISKYMAKGVTKTERIKKMDSILLEVENLEAELTNLEINFISSDRIANIRKIIVNERIEELNKEFDELLKQGIQGARIWGTSETLKKCKSFVDDAVNFEDIPDIDLVLKNKRYESVRVLGIDRIIKTYYFDIDKTPELKKILTEHIEKLRNKVKDNDTNEVE